MTAPKAKTRRTASRNGIRTEVDDLIRYLNMLIVVDRECVEALIEARVPCNKKMAAHPTVQVGKASEITGDSKAKGHLVGLLGILNGYCGAFKTGKYAGWGAIAAVTDSTGNLTEFIRTDRRPRR